MILVVMEYSCGGVVWVLVWYGDELAALIIPAKLLIKYKDPIDTSQHRITFNLTPGGGVGGNGVDTSTLYNITSGRMGFLYRLGGLNREQRYRVNMSGLRGESEVLWFNLVFITGEDDGDNIYNLTGIFLVLGISTIIMVVVMVCVGYEKLIHQKKDECCRFLCCKRKRRGDNSRPPPTSSISPEPLVVRDGRGSGFDKNSAIRY
ncbi:hypothetical protein Pcinc_043516 [Petrolisthes cinctipes]|uniref:Uncharacterized protein n=2 Tax=Petrolisthes cinctipes TaxID=88211 RepID=A0AAE1BIZ8_PETCI|nr:hypothetical protein Pcinc_043516 [Petrolisthes cinctipes]